MSCTSTQRQLHLQTPVNFRKNWHKTVHKMYLGQNDRTPNTMSLGFSLKRGETKKVKDAVQ